MDAPVVASLWERLEAAARGAYAPWRQMVLCTRDEARADGRMVILREADPHVAAVGFYSDARAGKMSQCDDPVALVLWAPELQLQLRLYGRAEILRAGAEVDARWLAVGRRAAENYRGALEPGHAVPSAEACAHLAPEDGRQNFAVVRVAIYEMDALWLQEKKRLRAERLGEGWQSRWVQI